MVKSRKRNIATGIVVPIIVAVIMIIPSFLNKIVLNENTTIDKLKGSYICTSRKIYKDNKESETIKSSVDRLLRMVITEDKTMYLYIDGGVINCLWSIVIRNDVIELFPIAGSRDNPLCRKRDKIVYRLRKDKFYWFTDSQLYLLEEKYGNIKRVEYEFTKLK